MYFRPTTRLDTLRLSLLAVRVTLLLCMTTVGDTKFSDTALHAVVISRVCNTVIIIATQYNILYITIYESIVIQTTINTTI